MSNIVAGNKRQVQVSPGSMSSTCLTQLTVVDGDR